MSILFDASYYMNVRPDVLNAYINSGAQAGTGMSWDSFAEQHYNNHGWKEGYNPNATFNTQEYLEANVDVLEAGVNPFQHYLTHGLSEGRAPNARTPSRDEFDWETYVAANADLQEAGIDTAEEAYTHFIMHGQFEVRPGKPDVGTPGETLRLTIGEDDLTGTANDDVFVAQIIQDNSGSLQQTLSGIDTIDGGAGRDTLRATLDDDAGAPVISNVEVLNLRSVDATAELDLANVSGAEEVWSDRSTDDLTLTNVGAGIALGMRATTADLYADLQDDVDALTINLANVGTETAASTIELSGGDLESLNIAVTGENFIDVADGSTDLDAVADVTISGAGDLEADLTDLSGLENLNAAAATGSLALDLTGIDLATNEATITTGSGDDVVVVDAASVVEEVTIDLGEGINALGINGVISETQLGALEFDNVSNVDILVLTSALTLTTDATLDLEDLEGASGVVFGGAVNLGTSSLVFAGASELAVDFEGSAGNGSLDFDEAITVVISNEGVVDVEILGADIASLTLIAEANATYELTKLEALETLDLSGSDEAADLVIDASGADFEGAVTINIGVSDLDYTTEGGAVRETFTFVGEDIGTVVIHDFTAGVGGNADRLDFSQFAGVSGLDDLDLTFDGTDTVISSDAFDGSITVLGFDLTNDAANFVF